MVFDMDETLIHKLDSDEPTGPLTHYVTVPGRASPLPFNLRPFTKECLEKANELFEVVLFTAAVQPYADAVLDYIDPTKTLFQHRLYRTSCV